MTAPPAAGVELLRRLLVVGALGVWIGGLTFYGAFVVPSAHEALGSHREAGFVTRIVTMWWNAIGVPSLLLLGWNLRVAAGTGGGWLRLLRRTWWWLLVCQVALFALHAVLDSHLDPAGRGIDDPDHFYQLHRVYLLVSGLLWLGGIGHALAALGVWRDTDRESAVSAGDG